MENELLNISETSISLPNIPRTIEKTRSILDTIRDTEEKKLLDLFLDFYSVADKDVACAIVKKNDSYSLIISDHPIKDMRSSNYWFRASGIPLNNYPSYLSFLYVIGIKKCVEFEVKDFKLIHDVITSLYACYDLSFHEVNNRQEDHDYYYMCELSKSNEHTILIDRSLLLNYDSYYSIYLKRIKEQIEKLYEGKRINPDLETVYNYLKENEVVKVIEYDNNTKLEEDLFEEVKVLELEDNLKLEKALN